MKTGTAKQQERRAEVAGPLRQKYRPGLSRGDTSISKCLRAAVPAAAVVVVATSRWGPVVRWWTGERVVTGWRAGQRIGAVTLTLI